MPQISVIMPVHNSEKFITNSIESVIKQTFRDWELIIINDGSTDGTQEIIDRYAHQDSRIKLIITKKNEGPPASRNLGLDIAIGRYVAFLDSDDTWNIDKLEKQLSFMQSNNCKLSISQYDMKYKDKIIKRIRPKLDRFTYWDNLKTNYIGTLTVMINMDYANDIKFKSVPKSDYVFWLEFLKKNGKGHCIQESLATYKVRNNSVSSNKIKAAYGQWRVYRNIEKFTFTRSLYYFLTYSYHGIKKHRYLLNPLHYLH